MQPKSGVKPKRYRAYYRALKRGEAWAVYLSKLPPMSRALWWLYDNDLVAQVVSAHNPLFDIIEKNGAWVGKHIPVKIKL